MPDWGLGYWQSTLRYQDTAEVLAVVREHVVERGLPMSVLVIDALHWPLHGDWAFKAADWPRVEEMTAELRRLGVRVLVSTWPLVNPASANHAALEAIDGFALGPDGRPAGTVFVESDTDEWVRLSLIDNTRPAVRELVFDRMRRGYLDRGVAGIWLDGCEPETIPMEPESITYAAGPGLATQNQFPREQARLVAEGQWAMGRHDVVTLARSAWAGSQRYGVVLWSGDVHSTWDALRRQVRAGLGASLAGLPWWTTDIGGFLGGRPDEEAFRELFVRWFQYGTFCPVMRVHGFREPARGIAGPGGPTEVWAYGERAYPVLVAHLQLRQRLLPYLRRLADEATATGLPPMRPLFVDFPGDAQAWDVDDAFMLGPDLLVAPVLEPGATARDVYLPADARWRDAATGEVHDGGSLVRLDAPFERIPVLVREGAPDPFAPAR
jgi:alpha-D-xyloside xylohydrolase